MVIHVLPGDAQTETFKQTGIEGEVVVCREAMVEGPADNPDDLWSQRADFHSPGDHASYLANVVSEFEKLINTAPGSEINLWFEYELFCQANMWFCLYLLRDTDAAIYRVAPVTLAEKDIWSGFGRMDGDDLRRCFEGRIRLGKEDVELGSELWKAFSAGDYELLSELSRTASEAFPYLDIVTRAAAEKDTRPARILKEIAADGITEFDDVFGEFSKRAGVYGYGDLQVKKILGDI